MKKAIVLCAVMMLLSACGPAGTAASGGGGSSSESISAPVQSDAAAQSQSAADSITPEDGVRILEAQLGTEDPATGNLMSYGYEDTVTLDGTDYYRYRVSWLVDGNHMSYLTDYLVSTDGRETREYLPEDAPASLEADLLSAADALLREMAEYGPDHGFSVLSDWCGDAGVTFSPYGAVTPGQDLTFSGSQLQVLDADTQAYIWGSYDGSGNPIELTPADYWEQFIWDADWTAAPSVMVDAVAQAGNTPENVAEAYPGAHWVEYHFDQVDPSFGGADWCSLKLVFANSGAGAGQLIGIIHSAATY